MRQEQHDRQIDYVEFSTTDIEASKRFYGAVFGWTFQDFGPEYTSFADGRLTGGFAKTDAVQAGSPLVVLYAVDLAAAEAAVREHGGNIVKQTFEFPGGRRFHFQDPTGNVLAVWSNA
jgi:predicted enzyme related to lactoylglutathione lyase